MTPADVALMTSVMAGLDMRDRDNLPKADFDWMEPLKGDLKGVRVAYSRTFGYAPVEPAVIGVVDEAVKVFARDLGCVVEEAVPDGAIPRRLSWAS